jgi:hypothetical protein
LFRFLGHSHHLDGRSDCYYSHCQLRDVLAKTRWDEPFFWEITHTKQIVQSTALLFVALLRLSCADTGAGK